MANMNIKKGDNVLVITGKDNGKVAEVLACYPKDNRVTVKGVNIVTKHNKPRSAQDKGGIVKVEGKIDASNVQLVCPVCGKATRVAHKEENGKNVRICKKCGANMDATKKAAKATKAPAKAEAKAEEAKPAAKKTTTTKTAATKSTAAKSTTTKTTATKSTTKTTKEAK